jgi:hypothetical protein
MRYLSQYSDGTFFLFEFDWSVHFRSGLVERGGKLSVKLKPVVNSSFASNREKK